MTGKIGTIVVGVATLRREDPVLRPAVELAEALGARLHVVHAFLPEDPTVNVFAHPRYGRNTLQVQEGAVVSALEAQVEAIGGGVRVRCRAVAGDAATALRQVVREVGADLVVAGATRRGPVARTVLGTTCGHVLRGSRVPVLMLRPAADGARGRVLVTTDLSPLSGEVYDRGVEVARSLVGGDAPSFRSLFVASDLPPAFSAVADLSRRARQEECERFLGERRERPEGMEARVRVGDPAREIVAEAAAWEAGLIVVGSHARRGAARLILGSVAEAVVRDAPCSVLVIPGRSVDLLSDGEVEEQLTGAAT